jgi:hypothetical protein
MKKILFLGCNYDQIPYLLSLKKKELYIIGIDKNENAPGKEFCNSFYNVGYEDLESIIKIGDIEKFTSEDYVFTAAAQFSHKAAAHFSEQFDIVYPSEDTIDICLDKIKFYSKFGDLGISYPKTLFIEDSNDFIRKTKTLDRSKNYYLKSDFSKNPNYVYKLNLDDMDIDSIFWGKDRYLREMYVLQEEVIGRSLRINMYGDRYNVYDFYKSIKEGDLIKDQLEKIGLIESLQKYITTLGLDNWLIKFDVILNDAGYAVLDVGLDPPYRMVTYANKNTIDFASLYVDQYLMNTIRYPIEFD